MVFNYNKLKGRIVEKFGTNSNFADAMGWSSSTLSQHITNNSDRKRAWKQSDILDACRVLDIPHEEIPMYFFCLESSNSLTTGV